MENKKYNEMEITHELSELSDAECQEKYGGYVYETDNGRYVWAWEYAGDEYLLNRAYATKFDCFINNANIKNSFHNHIFNNIEK
jgi:hypothetical protein